jgi:O-antigen ligase
MSSYFATIAYISGILALFLLDRDRKQRVSIALWIPVIWLSIAGSRPLSAWLQPSSVAATAESYLEGSPTDRYFALILLAAAAAVLASRQRRLKSLLRTNWPLIAYVLYCGISCLWSDFSDVAFKRWVKFLTDLAMVLVVVTDRDPSSAVKKWLTRVGFLLLPLSVLFIKYYPDLGREYRSSDFSAGVWVQSFTGVTTGKNTLGVVCLVLGLGAVWRLLEDAPEMKKFGRLRWICVHVIPLTIAMWLFWIAHSATSGACFLMGAGLIFVIGWTAVSRQRWLIHLLVGSILLITCSTLFLGIDTGLLQSIGRNSTLTGRTALWDLVLGMHTNPMIGTGFESFWLGARLETVWNVYWWHPNQAHNGYIELYLNLGWVGLALFFAVVLNAYRNAVSLVRVNPHQAALYATFLVSALVYNFTEAAFKTMNPMGILFLFVAITVPRNYWVTEHEKPTVHAAKVRLTWASTRDKLSAISPLRPKYADRRRGEAV